MSGRRADPLVLTTHRCAVTAYDRHISVLTDGRRRGLWIRLKDDSAAHRENYERCVDAAVRLMADRAGGGAPLVSRLGAWMAADGALRPLLRAEISEMALLEWPAVREVRDALTAELRRR